MVGRVGRDDLLALHANLDEVAHGGLTPRGRLEAVRRMGPSFGFLRRTLPNHADSAFAAVFLK